MLILGSFMDLAFTQPSSLVLPARAREPHTLEAVDDDAGTLVGDFGLLTPAGRSGAGDDGVQVPRAACAQNKL